jgi:hypothetical protein
LHARYVRHTLPSTATRFSLWPAQSWPSMRACCGLRKSAGSDPPRPTVWRAPSPEQCTSAKRITRIPWHTLRRLQQRLSVSLHIPAGRPWWCSAVRQRRPLLARSRVILIDEQDPKSKQPYHAAESLNIEAAASCLEEYMAVSTRRTGAAPPRRRARLPHTGPQYRDACGGVFAAVCQSAVRCREPIGTRGRAALGSRSKEGCAARVVAAPGQRDQSLDLPMATASADSKSAGADRKRCSSSLAHTCLSPPSIKTAARSA